MIPPFSPSGQDQDHELLTVREMAAYLKVSRLTMQRYCREGWVPAAKIGKSYRVRRADLTAWYESRKQKVN